MSDEPTPTVTCDLDLERNRAVIVVGPGETTWKAAMRTRTMLELLKNTADSIAKCDPDPPREVEPDRTIPGGGR